VTNFSGKHLKNLRIEAGYTQRELATRLGISRETVVAIENDHKASINSLKMDVVSDWWNVCKSRSSAETKASFKELIFKFFQI